MVPCHQAVRAVSETRAVTQDFHQVTGKDSIALWDMSVRSSATLPSKSYG